MGSKTSTWSDRPAGRPIQVTREVRDGPVPTESATAPAESEGKDEPIRVLFLCTHNSARSQLAEAALRLQGGPRVQAFSAGTHPTAVHPMATALLAQLGIDGSQQRSKSMAEFVGQTFDYVITLCDGARDECPTFPGDPVRIHWDFPDPSLVDDEDDRSRAFATVWRELNTRICHLLILPHPTSGRRVVPASLAGMAEAQSTPATHQPGGVTQKLSTLTQKLHLPHGV